MSVKPIPAFLSILFFLFLAIAISSIEIETAGAFQGAPPEARPNFGEPSLSPDRAEIVFVSGGDIWTVGVNGGEARLLVSHPATESRPLYSPDGRSLAFVSNRTGNGDIYILSLESGELKRLTFDDASEQLDGWSRDGRWIYFSSTSKDIAGMNDLFRVAAGGGTPMLYSADRFTNEFWAAPLPDGGGAAFTARGNSSGQWWRKGHSHLDECEIWSVRDGAAPAYERLVSGESKNMWPMWSPDARTLYFVSDRGGAQNIWARSSGGALRQVTKFNDGRVLWPSISMDGKLIVFERNFRIWKLDTASGSAAEVAISRRGAPAGPGIERAVLSNQFQELALSPDGKKVAVVARGEIFAASARDGGDAARVTRTAAPESQVTWGPDSRRIAYVSTRDGAARIYLYDFTRGEETPITSGTQDDYNPTFSPDGKQLVFLRGGRELRLLDLESKQDRLLAGGYFGRPPIVSDRAPVWSHDGKWVAYLSTGERAFTNAYAVPVAGGEARPLSFLPNSFGNSISWSPDGRYIVFSTGQRTEEGRLARVDLTPRLPKFREDQFRDLFKDEPPRNPPGGAAGGQAPAAQPQGTREPKKPVEISFDGIRERLSFIPTGLDADAPSISPDGKWLLVTASTAGQQNLYVYSLDELSREPAVARQLTSTPGFKSDAQFTPDSREVFFLEGGRINAINIENRQARSINVNAEMDVDFSRIKMEVFGQAWSYLRDHFYDEKFHGADWNAIRGTYEPQVAGAATPDEMRRVINLMVGELNASHLGISAPPSGSGNPVGKLGLRFDRAEYETAGRLKVTEVIALGPAAISGRIKAGDYIVSVDGVRLGAGVNLDEQLANKVTRKVELAVSSAADGTDPRTVEVMPVTTATEKGLLYRQWVGAARAYVEKASNGRLGFVHMPDMSANSLTQLYADLDADNQGREGVVIDIRNNNGGFVNAYALDVFARRGYLTMTVRGNPPAPARSVLGQRSLERPTILVTNQHSLSDAEDFTEGYRALKLGKVVGEPTAGWIIYTWNTSLIDGSGFRLPRQKVQDSAGQVMELNPRPVDVASTRPIGESLSGRDSQLDAAVRELLRQIDSARKN